jgi:hypothetical protein
MTFLGSVWFALVLGIVAALLLPVVSWIASGSPVKGLLVGADGKLSTSKCQFWIWTEVVLFAYVFLFTSHMQGGKSWGASSPMLPTDVLILMGLSVVTAATAKGIAASRPDAAAKAKTVAEAASTARSLGTAPTAPTRYAQLVTDNENGEISSFSKVQILVWTVVAACVYVVTAILARGGFVAGTATSYPDVDAALVVLVGLSHGAYLGNKIAANGKTDV